MRNAQDNAAHTCSYSCDRPECIKAQRDELVMRMQQHTRREDVSGQLEYLAYLEAAVADAGFKVMHDGGSLGTSNFRIVPIAKAQPAAAPADTWFADQLAAMGEVIPLDSTPAAPGIDLTPFRELADAWQKESSEALGQFPPIEGNHRSQMIRLGKCATKLHNLIDASPKGATLNEQFGSAEGLDSLKGGSEAPTDGEVLVTVSGLTGSGKSAVAGEIEILCKALGLEVEWVDSEEEKRLTHSDWTEALELYKPRVRIVEVNIPRTSAQASDAEVRP